MGNEMDSCRVLINALALFSAQTAMADQKISGFGDFTFGTTFNAVDEKLTLTEETSNNPSLEVFGAEEMTSVAGEDYTLTFAFKNKELVQINLFRDYDASAISCTADTERVFGAVQARYGAADAPLDKSDPMSMSARFTDAAGATITVLGASFGAIEKCIISVAYQDNLDGNTF